MKYLFNMFHCQLIIFNLPRKQIMNLKKKYFCKNVEYRSLIIMIINQRYDPRFFAHILLFAYLSSDTRNEKYISSLYCLQSFQYLQSIVDSINILQSNSPDLDSNYRTQYSIIWKSSFTKIQIFDMGADIERLGPGTKKKSKQKPWPKLFH